MIGFSLAPPPKKGRVYLLKEGRVKIRYRFIFVTMVTFTPLKGDYATMAKGKRDQVILKCTDCGNENYLTTRNKKTHTAKMEIKKFCPHCRKMTLHKEKK